MLPTRRHQEDPVDYWTRSFGKVLLFAAKKNRVTEQSALWKDLSECARFFGSITGEKEKKSDLDSLTRLPNARNTLLLVKKISQLSSKAKAPSCVIFVDIDDFKKYNDQYGHEAGNKIISQIVKIHREIVNDYKKIGSFIGRYGGEEFIIGLPFVKEETALNLAEKCRRAVERQAPVTCSYGVSSTEYKGSSATLPAKEVIELANVAVHLAKGKTGGKKKRKVEKNKVIVWEKTMPKKVADIFSKNDQNN